MKHQSRAEAVAWDEEKRKNRPRNLAGRMANTARHRLLTPGNIGRGIPATSSQWLRKNFRPMHFQISKHSEIPGIRIGFLYESIHPHPGVGCEMLKSRTTGREKCILRTKGGIG